MPPRKSSKKTTTIKKSNKVSKKVTKKVVATPKSKIDSDEENVSDIDLDENDLIHVEDFDEKSAVPTKSEYTPKLTTNLIFVRPEDRRTTEILTSYEYSTIVGTRAHQIENGGQIFTDDGGLTDPIELAKKEIRDKKCPLSVIRQITDEIAELWHVNEMTIPVT